MPDKTEKQSTVDILLKRDVWDEDGVRMRASDQKPIAVPVDQAMDMVENGLATRAK